MDIVTTKKIEEKEVKIIRLLQGYAENHGFKLDMVVFPIGGNGNGC